MQAVRFLHPDLRSLDGPLRVSVSSAVDAAKRRGRAARGGSRSVWGRLHPVPTEGACSRDPTSRGSAPAASSEPHTRLCHGSAPPDRRRHAVDVTALHVGALLARIRVGRTDAPGCTRLSPRGKGSLRNVAHRRRSASLLQSNQPSQMVGAGGLGAHIRDLCAAR